MNPNEIVELAKAGLNIYMSLMQVAGKTDAEIEIVYKEAKLKYLLNTLDKLKKPLNDDRYGKDPLYTKNVHDMIISMNDEVK